MTNLWKSLVLGTIVTSMTACSGGGGGDAVAPSEASKTMVVAGELQSATLQAKLGEILPLAADPVWKMRCTPGSGPNVAGEGVIGIDNKFRFEIKGMQEGASLGCWIFIDGIPSIPLAFASTTSMTGGTANQMGYAPKKNSTEVSFGVIEIVTVGGVSIAKVTAPIEDNGSEALAAFQDMTGEWKPTLIIDAANGYSHMCDAEVGQDKEDCLAEWTEDSKFFIHTLQASKADQTSRWVLNLWQTKDAFVNCGFKEALPADWQYTGQNSATATGVFSAGYATLTALKTAITDGTLKTANAPFRKWVDESNSSQNNCLGSSTCDTAKNCAQLLAGITSPTENDSANCIMNAMHSGGLSHYNWGAGVCARRMDKFPHESNDGETITWKDSPTSRHISSELLVSANNASASFTEPDNDDGCEVIRTTSFNITQHSTTSATIELLFSMKQTSGAGTCDNASPWMAAQLNKVVRHKLKLTKVQ